MIEIMIALKECCTLISTVWMISWRSVFSDKFKVLNGFLVPKTDHLHNRSRSATDEGVHILLFLSIDTRLHRLLLVIVIAKPINIAREECYTISNLQ